MVNAVIDTNVIISGVLTAGACRDILSALRRNEFSCAVSPLMMDETVKVLHRDKFKLLILEEDRDETIELLEQYLSIPVAHSVSVCRDADDNHILSCALGFESDVIISGDKDLLCLNPFRGIPIVTPAEFVKKFL